VTDEPHAVVRLLLARMESHPEEFSNDNGRWVQWLDELMPFVTEKERLMLRKPMMQTIHEDVMDELLNGPERRRKHKEDTEYERHLAQAMQHTQRQQLRVGTLSGDMNPIGYASGGGGGASLPVSLSPYQSALAQGIVGKPLHQTWLDEYVNIGSITAAQPEPKLKPYDKIKQALGIKK
jgi:hypothetical protein